MPKSLSLLTASAALIAAAPAEPMSPTDFVAAAIGSDAYEIMAGQVALANSQSPAVRAFAQQMIADHTRTSAALQQIATSEGMPPPPLAVGADQARLLGALQSLAGAEFDKAYAMQQVLAHQQALVTEQGYAANGSDTPLRQTAAGAVPVITRHLQMAQGLAGAAGG